LVAKERRLNQPPFAFWDYCGQPEKTANFGNLAIRARSLVAGEVLA
jgi:hypothetical protein